MEQEPSLSRWKQGTPAGLDKVDMSGAVQQVAQRRQFMEVPYSVSVGKSCGTSETARIASSKYKVLFKYHSPGSSFPLPKRIVPVPFHLGTMP